MADGPDSEPTWLIPLLFTVAISGSAMLFLGLYPLPTLLAACVMVPAGIIYAVAVSKGESEAYALWGVLSVVGLVVAMVLMLSRQPHQRRRAAR